MTKIMLAALSLLATQFALAALPAPGEIQKDGDCPANYTAKGNQCHPTADARFAFIKFGNCPAAYEEQGNYCIATSEARLAIRKPGMSCPAGFSEAGNYCVSDK